MCTGKVSNTAERDGYYTECSSITEDGRGRPHVDHVVDEYLDELMKSYKTMNGRDNLPDHLPMMAAANTPHWRPTEYPCPEVN